MAHLTYLHTTMYTYKNDLASVNPQGLNFNIVNKHQLTRQDVLVKITSHFVND